MALHGAVRGLVLVVPLRAHQHRRHHGERPERTRHHVAHHVAVVVLARPDEAAVGLHHARHRVVDERIEVLDAGFLEARGVLGIVDLLEDVLETVVVLLRDGVLRGEPDVLLHVEGVLEAAACEALDGRVEVVHALGDARAVELVDELARLGAVGGGVDELHFAGTGNAQLRVLVHVAVGVAGDGDGLYPVVHARLDARHGDGRAEHRAVEQGADGAVGALPHLLQVVLVHARGVRRDGGALHGHAQALGGLGGIHGHLVVGGVAVLEAQVVVLGLEVDVRADQLVLDHLPDDARHLVAVHLHQRRGHLNLRHCQPFPRCAARPHPVCTAQSYPSPGPRRRIACKTNDITGFWK